MTYANRLLLILLLALTGCAALQPLETPRVSIQQVRWAPVNGSPGFEFDLEVLNPNAADLALEGVVYTLSLDGVELLQGAANELPLIKGYSSEQITLTAKPNLISGLRLLTRLASGELSSVNYRLDARIDPAGWMPVLHAVEEGELSLRSR